MKKIIAVLSLMLAVSGASYLSATENSDKTRTQDENELATVISDIRRIRKEIEFYQIEAWFLGLGQLSDGEKLEIKYNNNQIMVWVGTTHLFILEENVLYADVKMIDDHLHCLFNPADRAVALEEMKQAYGALTDSPEEIRMILLQKRIPAKKCILETLKYRADDLLDKICGPFKLAGSDYMDKRSQCVRGYYQCYYHNRIN